MKKEELNSSRQKAVGSRQDDSETCNPKQKDCYHFYCLNNSFACLHFVILELWKEYICRIQKLFYR